MASTVRPRSSKQTAKAEATRRALLAAARSLFGDHGYTSTSVEEVVRAAGMTKGALYHHFKDKDELFRAVVEDVKGDVTRVVGAAFMAAAAVPDALDSVTQGCLAMIDAHRDPAVQRITILDARSVLDAAVRRDLSNRYEVAVIRGALRRAMRHGVIDPQPLAPLSHVIAGALAEACALIAEADDEGAAREEIGAVVVRLLEGLRPRPQEKGSTSSAAVTAATNAAP